MKLRKRWLLLLALILLATWTVYPWIRSGSAEGDQELVIASWNLMALNKYGAQGIDGLSELRPWEPDVVCLQEFPFRRGELQAEILFQMGLVHRKDAPYAGQQGSGLSVFSRYPVLSHEIQPLPPFQENRVASLVELEVAGRSFWLTTVHFPNSDIHELGIRRTMKQEILGPTMRLEQAEALGQWLQAWEGRPLAIAGDFNTFPFSAAWRELCRNFYDAFPIGSFFSGTYQGRYDIEAKIDHVFLSDEVDILESHIPRIPGSDHWPVVVRVRF